MVKKTYQNSVRIISGKWKGRRIEFIDAQGLRPTKDFIRESLFNWLAADIANSRCLDLYAGSGALSFEAASRGAADVVAVDHNYKITTCLQSQSAKLCAENIQIVYQSAEGYIETYQGRPFDIIFLDPPFEIALNENLFKLLIANNLIAENGKIYLEQASKSVLNLDSMNYTLLKEKQSGHVAYRLYRFD